MYKLDEVIMRQMHLPQRSVNHDSLKTILREESGFGRGVSQFLGKAHAAAIFGDLKTLSEMPASERSLFQSDNVFGWNVYHWAAICKRKEVISKLKQKFNGVMPENMINATDKMGNSPMDYASRIQNQDKRAGVFNRIRTGDKFVDRIVNGGTEKINPSELGMYTNPRGAFGLMPLHWSIILHDKELFSFLLTRYILQKNTAVDITRWTPLHLASLVDRPSASNEEPMATMLLKNGARPELKDIFGKTHIDYCLAHITMSKSL
jgi:ankyrin repeat protein